MIERKKISFVIGALTPGGAERVISTLSNELINRYEITIITFKKSSPFYALDKRIKVLYCEQNIDTPSSFIDSIRLNYKLTKRVYKILKKENIDIAIGFITSANVITIIASKFAKIPCVISERNNPLVVKTSWFWNTLRLLCYPFANKLVLQTEGVKKFYKKRIKEDKMVVIPNPISPELLAKVKDETRQNIILTVGRLEPHKCHKLIIQAFETINPKDWKLIIIGSGSQEHKLKEYVAKKGLNEKIEILGKIKDMHRYYNKAGIFVFASKYEGFPNVLIEALSFGVPTISSDCDFGPSDLITHGENGYLFQVDNQKELECKLNKLINDTSIRYNFTKNAKLSTHKFRGDIVEKQWEDIISGLI